MPSSTWQPKTDCFYFQGDKPCLPHKESGARCQCEKYIPTGPEILLIKLGRSGDIVRTAPLICKLDDVFGSKARVDIITDCLEVMNLIELDVDRYKIWPSTDFFQLLGKNYAAIINLDKDSKACQIATLFKNMGNTPAKSGYFLNEQNKIVCTSNFQEAWLAGIDDNYLKNEYTTSYTEGLFKAFNLPYSKDRGKWRAGQSIEKQFDVLLIPNAGKTWSTRHYPTEKWNEVILQLVEDGFTVGVLTAARDEEVEVGLDLHLSDPDKVVLIPTNDYRDWFNTISSAKTVVCMPSLGLNIANQMNVPVTLLLNVFSPYEFLNDLTPKSTILLPKDKDCIGCYKSKCELECLSGITPEEIVRTVEDRLR